MITIISGTNRAGSQTLKVVHAVRNILESLGQQVNIIDLQNFDYKNIEAFKQVQQDILIPTTKFFIVAPEYNGSFPGILKLFIDTCDVRNVWHGKKAALLGVAEGRAGNLRGLDHLTNILNYLKVNVMPNKVPISKVSAEISDEGFTQDLTLQTVTQQLTEFTAF